MSDEADNAQAGIEATEARIRATAQAGPRIFTEAHLARLKAVTHCRECGEEISTARKNAIAHAIRCAICETQNERKAK